MLLDRARVKKWQKVIYAVMAVLMVAFLIYIPVGTNGCGGSSGQPTMNDRIKTLQARLSASPGNTATMLALAEAYQLAAGQQERGTAGQDADWTKAAQYYRQYLDATQDAAGVPEAKRVETLQTLAVVYANLRDYAKAVRVYGELTDLQSDNAEFFLQMGSFAVQAGDKSTALLAFDRFLELDPDSPNASTIRDWVNKNGGEAPTPSPSPSGSEE